MLDGEKLELDTRFFILKVQISRDSPLLEPLFQPLGPTYSAFLAQHFSFSVHQLTDLDYIPESSTSNYYIKSTIEFDL